MSNLTAPLDLLLLPLVQLALREDLGRAGDLTTDALVPRDLIWRANLTARQAGVIAGLDLVRLTLHSLDPAIMLQVQRPDGSAVQPGEVIATLTGPAHQLLKAERVALNFLCHLSGIATATALLVDAIKPHRARLVDTRKTTPGLRVVEKYAVTAGGGANHRFGLDDAILIKDNHVAVAGSIQTAMERARAAAGHLVKIELEVDTLAQLTEVLSLPARLCPDVIMLDNMVPPLLTEAVALIGGRCLTEASGRINLNTVNAIAATGVDLISCGWITHSAPILDIGLDEPNN